MNNTISRWFFGHRLGIALIAACLSLPMSAGTVVYLPLDGNTQDASGQANHAVSFHTAGWPDVTYPADVPGQVILDGVGGPAINPENTHSVLTTRKGMYHGGNGVRLDNDQPPYPLDLDHFTMEVFFKLNFPSCFGERVSLMGRSDAKMALIWVNGVDKIEVGFRGLTRTDNGKGYIRTSTSPEHGKWHHLALTYDVSPDGSTTTVQLFLDYQLSGQATYNGTYDYASLRRDFVIGTFNQGAETVQFDEFRFSDAVLNPNQFLVVDGTVVSNAPPPLPWSLDGLIQVVQPMCHDWTGRLPILAWSVPDMPAGDELLALRASGELRRRIDLLAERGIVEVVRMAGFDSTPAGALAMALTIQEAGLPVYVLMPINPDGENAIWPDAAMWVQPTNDGTVGSTQAWPIYPLAVTASAADSVRALLQPLKDAGIEVTGLWTDYEQQPHPWGGVYTVQQRPEVRSHYPDPSVLDTFDSFKTYILDLRHQLLKKVFEEPLHALYPNAIWGNYGSGHSSLQFPRVDNNLTIHPPRPSEPGDVTMLGLYANTRLLPKYTQGDWVLTQTIVDDVYWNISLRLLSSSNINDGPGSTSFPYVSRYVTDNREPRFVDWEMSPQRYREMLRHFWLRGADGMFAFNRGSVLADGITPRYGASPRQSFEALEDQRLVMDEMLGFRDFLENGQPITFHVPAMYDHSPMWSGLKLGNTTILLRIVSLSDQPQSVTIPTFPNESVTLTAPVEGAYYLIEQGLDPQQVQP